MPKENITISDVDVERFHKAIEPEIKGLNAKRFSYDVVLDDESITFMINADDAVALKAARSSIEKLHSVFKKMQVLSR